MIWTNQNALASISQTEHVECSLAGNRIIDPGGLLVIQIRQPWKLLQLILTLHYEKNLTATCTFDFELECTKILDSILDGKLLRLQSIGNFHTMADVN